MPTPAFTARKQEEAAFYYEMGRESAEYADAKLTIEWQEDAARASRLARRAAGLADE